MPKTISRTRTTSRPLTRTQLGILWGALASPAPLPPGKDGRVGFLYSTPGAGRFIESGEPLPLEYMLAQRLVPATQPARVKAALAVFAPQETDAPSPMGWSTWKRDHGELIVWYPSFRLWGSTGYQVREGKEGTVFARAPEPLVADALAHQLLPWPDLATPALMDRLRMQEIIPQLLDETAANPLADCMRWFGMQAVSTSEPRYYLVATGSEWLVSLLYQDRHLVVLHRSRDLPKADAIIWRLLVLRRQLAGCPGEREWDRLYGETRDPYDVCLRVVREFEAFCGPAALGALENAFATMLSRLERVAQRAASRPFFVASALARYQERHQLADLQLAQQLGGAVEDLCRLYLCRMPGPEHFQQDVQKIAEHAQVDAARLVRLLKEEKAGE